MQEVREFLKKMKLPTRDAYDLPSSEKRFPDGAQWRVEIPTCEGPRVFEAVLDESRKLGVPVHRVSQGSGIMLQTEDEVREMVRMGSKEGIEVCLFVGPRGTFDIGASSQSPEGKVLAYRLRGADQLVYGLEDLRRGCELGLRSVLVADEGLLWVAGEMKKAGKLPSELVLKVSIRASHGNPASIKLLENIGASTYNVIGDLTLPQLAAIRQAVDIPLDLYVELSDGFGGIARYYEIPEIIRVTAPVYIKFGTMNAPRLYPSGKHLEDVAAKLGRERIHRARITVDLVRRYYPDAILSGTGPKDLGIPKLD